MVSTSARAPGVNVMRDSSVSICASGSPASSATRSRSAPSNSISPRMARSVMAATAVANADEIGEFVDALLLDHGRIHVGDEQPLRRPSEG